MWFLLPLGEVGDGYPDKVELNRKEIFSGTKQECIDRLKGIIQTIYFECNEIPPAISINYQRVRCFRISSDQKQVQIQKDYYAPICDLISYGIYPAALFSFAALLTSEI